MPHPEHPKCPFCPENGKVVIIDEQPDVYLVQVVTDGVPVEGRYLIIPKSHITSPQNLPANYTWQRGKLLGAIPGITEGEAYNLATNVGKEAGQTVKHLHEWVIIRDDMLQLGTSGLIDRCMALSQENSRLRALLDDRSHVTSIIEMAGTH